LELDIIYYLILALLTFLLNTNLLFCLFVEDSELLFAFALLLAGVAVLLYLANAWEYY